MTNTKGLFVTATGTDIGKTYVTALLVKTLHQAGYRAGYYKAALSGAIPQDGRLVPGDAHYVRTVSQIAQPLESMVSYIYEPAVSPHLAAKMANNPLRLSKVQQDYQAVSAQCDYVTVEGSGGIICPLRYDDKQQIMLTDVIKILDLSCLVVADAGLGTLNATLLTLAYLQSCGLNAKGIILNNYCYNDVLHRDNKYMLEQMSNMPIIDVLAPQAEHFNISAQTLAALYA